LLAFQKAEREFKEYVKDRVANAKIEFKELLRVSWLFLHVSYIQVL
jgi:hypothetical protein